MKHIHVSLITHNDLLHVFTAKLLLMIMLVNTFINFIWQLSNIQ